MGFWRLCHAWLRGYVPCTCLVSWGVTIGGLCAVWHVPQMAVMWRALGRDGRFAWAAYRYTVVQSAGAADSDCGRAHAVTYPERACTRIGFYRGDFGTLGAYARITRSHRIAHRIGRIESFLTVCDASHEATKSKHTKLLLLRGSGCSVPHKTLDRVFQGARRVHDKTPRTKLLIAVCAPRRSAVARQG